MLSRLLAWGDRVEGGGAGEGNPRRGDLETGDVLFPVPTPPLLHILAPPTIKFCLTLTGTLTIPCAHHELFQ